MFVAESDRPHALVMIALPAAMCIDRAVVAQSAAHPFIHFFTGQSRIVDRTMRHARTLLRLFREIAFMRDTDHVVHQSKRSCDLSRSGHERNNSAHE